MKKFSFSLVLLTMMFVSFDALAQSGSRVPSVVVNAFKSAFPKATDIDWDRSNGLYEVEFEIDRMDHEAWLDAEGNIIRHKAEVRTRSLPAQLRDEVRSQYRGYRISEAEKLSVGDQVVYKLELKTFTKEVEIIVDERGHVVEGFIW